MNSAFTLAPPGPPVPRVADTSSTTIELEWEPPAFNGGGEIMGYFVDKQLVGTNEWSRCTEKMVKVRQFTVKEIREGADYKLRVSAVNAAGEGPPGETEPVTVAEPQGTSKFSRGKKMNVSQCETIFSFFLVLTYTVVLLQQSLQLWNSMFLSRAEYKSWLGRLSESQPW